LSRYIKKFGRIGYALGPSEERGFAMWVGYDLVGVDDDLSHLGLVNVDSWTEERLAQHDVTTFIRVEPDDKATYEKLGIGRDS
jgi:hypothetical protein